MSDTSKAQRWAWADESGIWGIGDSPEAAQQDAESCAQEPVEGAAEPMTEAAYQHVERHGYDCIHGQALPIREDGRWLMPADRYPAHVAAEVVARRPDLCSGDAVATVLTTDPTLTADQVIAILDEAAEDWAAEQDHEARS